MKRTFALVIAISLLLTLFACTSDDGQDASKESSKETSSEAVSSAEESRASSSEESVEKSEDASIDDSSEESTEESSEESSEEDKALTDEEKSCISYLEFIDNGDGTAKATKGKNYYENLTYLVIPRYTPDGRKVTGIAESAFSGCDKLVTVKLPETLERIEQYAFEDCTSLSSINMPDSISYIGMEAFFYCQSLKKFHFPASLTRIEDGVFSYNVFEEVTIPGTVRYVDGAFGYSDTLKKVVVEEGVEVLDWGAFYGNDNLETVILPEGLRYIDSQQFCYSSIKTLDIPESVEYIGSGAFDYTDLEFVSYNNGLYYPKGSDDKAILVEVEDKSATTFTVSADTVIILPSAFTGSSVTEIRFEDGNDVFTVVDGAVIRKSDKTLICSVGSSVPTDGSVEKIGDYAFSENQNVKDVTVPSCVTELGRMVFYKSSLESITFEEGITEIPDYFLYQASELKTVNLPSSARRLGEMLIDGTGITSMTVPEGVEELGDYALSYAYSLEEVKLPSTLKTVGNGAFSSDKSLKSIVIPENVTYVGKYAFSYCEKLEIIFFGSGDISDSFDPDWLKNCSANVIWNYKESAAASYGEAEKASLPYLIFTDNEDGTASVRAAQSLYDKGIEKITIPSVAPSGNRITSVEKYGFEDAPAKEVVLPDTIEVINDYAFTCMKSLETVNMPKSLRFIGTEAFYGTKLVSVVFPESIEKVGARVFGKTSVAFNSHNGCDYLPIGENNYGLLVKATDSSAETVTIHKDTKVIAANAFYETPSDAAFAVESGNDVFACDGKSVIEKKTKTLVAANDDYVIPSDGSVEIIGDYVYYERSLNENLVIPEGIREIGRYAFCYTGIESVSLPESIEYVGDSAFFSDDLTEIVIHAGVTYEENVFAFNSSLKKVTIEEGVTVLPAYMFSNCTSLESIVLPSTLEKIGEYAFNYSGLKNVRIPDGVTEIGFGAFAYCKDLKTVFVPASVTHVDGYLFAFDDDALVLFEAPFEPSGWDNEYNKWDEDFDGRAAWGCDSDAYDGYADEEKDSLPFIYFTHDKDGRCSFYQYWHKNVSPETITVPEKSVFGETVTAVDYEAFFGESLKKITLPDTIEVVHSWTFYKCTSLTDIVFPSSVKVVEPWIADGFDIGGTVYNGGVYLKKGDNDKAILARIADKNAVSFTLAKECEFIDQTVFKETSIKTLNVEEGNKYYKSVGGTIVSLSDNSLVALCGDTPIPSGIEKIGPYSYYGNTENVNVVIPEGVKSIDRSFYKAKMKTVSLPSTLEEIGESAFDCCAEIEELAIPDSVKIIGGWAFSSCPDLKKVVLPGSLKEIPAAAFSWCSSLTEVVIPESVEVIGHDAFSCCYSLEHVTLPGGLKKIEKNAFYYCKSLKSVVIPASVETIGYNAFDSENMTDIYCEAESAPEGWDEDWSAGFCGTIHWGYKG